MYCCSQGINTSIQYVEHMSINRISKFEVIRMMNLMKKIKDCRHDPNMFPNFLKNLPGINTSIRYLQCRVNRVFVDTNYIN